MEKKDKTGIFLSGGGGIGSFHIGFFKALEEHGIKFDLVCGSSAGAIIAGASTYLKSDEMFERWKSLTLESVFKIDSAKIRNLEGRKRTLMLYRECILSCMRKDPNYMIDINDIRKLLYSCLDGDKIRESEVDLGVTSTLLPSLKYVKVFKDDMKVNPLEYILASLYLPVFSSSKIIDDRRYIDIARTRKYPLDMLKKKNCDDVYIVNIETNNLNRFYRPIRRDFNSENVTFINYEDKPSILDFSEEQALKNYQNGYETTLRVLERKLK